MHPFVGMGDRYRGILQCMSRLLLLALVMLLCLQACGATVKAPLDPANPAAVYLVDHGIHSCVMFPRDDGSVVAFCYSSYEYAAKDHDGALNGPAALLIPNSGTLGRREFRPSECSADGVCRAFMEGEQYYHIDKCYTIWVDKPDRERVLNQLEERFVAGASTQIDNRKRRFSFVRDDHAYGLFNTCNNESLSWLREMGCRVSGLGLAADFSVDCAVPVPRVPAVPPVARTRVRSASTTSASVSSEDPT
jgi:hypothetical protein